MSIAFSRDGAIATIRFARPEKLNALTLTMYRELGRAFIEARDDDAIRVIVLAGSGARAFCAGADLTESIPALTNGRFDISAWDPAHIKGLRLYKPVISAIRGVCMGAGFEIMLATDIRIAAQDATFQLPEPLHGFAPAGGTLVRLVRQIGYAHAMEILLTAKRFSATELAAKGVINHVVPSEDVEPVALEIASRIAQMSPTAIQTIKEAALTLQDLPWDEAFAKEAQLGQRAFTSDEARRGLEAFASRAKRD